MNEDGLKMFFISIFSLSSEVELVEFTKVAKLQLPDVDEKWHFSISASFFNIPAVSLEFAATWDPFKAAEMFDKRSRDVDQWVDSFWAVRHRRESALSRPSTADTNGP